MQKYQGTITKYDDDKKFGFIQFNHINKAIFFHINQFRPNRKPVIGNKVMFEIGEDKNGRACAVNIQEEAFVIQKQIAHGQRQQQKAQRRQAYEAHQERQEQKHSALNAICIFAVAYLIVITGVIFAFNLPKIILAWYAGISLFSFFAYYRDKLAAENDEWRTPESRLHTYDILGGWIGAAFAHKLLNHKATKPEFRLIYHATIIIHIIGFGACYFFLK